MQVIYICYNCRDTPGYGKSCVAIAENKKLMNEMHGENADHLRHPLMRDNLDK